MAAAVLSAMVVPATGTAATFVVTTTADGGLGSLRQAIFDANADPALDQVAFAIVDTGVPRIMPATALPAITAPLEIDGTTQPSAGLVELDGSDTASVAGLTITAGGSTVRGLVINGFQTAAIAISGASGNVIEGNLIGTDVDGLTGLSTSAVGIDVADSPGHRIGGVAAASRNVISGNNIGVYLHGAATVGNVIEGNFIGTEPSGFTAVANASHGVQVFLAGANTIGGPDPGAGNVISGNIRDGIAISSSGGIVIQGNAIGVGADLLTAVPNLRHGVRAFTGTHDTLVGGAGPNVIAFNGGSGIIVAANAGTGNTVRANSVHDNAQLGIDIGASAPTPNDVGDADGGPNLLQNFPVLDPLFPGGTKVSGVLDSVAGATFTIEVFATSQCDTTGYGEGAELVGTTMVSTDGTGHASFTLLLDREVDATVEVLAATATDAAGNTSEFSRCVPPLSVTTTTTSSSTTTTTSTTAGPTTSTTSSSTTTTTGAPTTSTSSTSTSTIPPPTTTSTTAEPTTSTTSSSTTTTTGASTTSTTTLEASTTTSTTLSEEPTTTTTTDVSTSTTSSTSTTTQPGLTTTSTSSTSTTSTTAEPDTTTTSTSMSTSTSTSSTQVAVTSTTTSSSTSSTFPRASTTTTTLPSGCVDPRDCPDASCTLAPTFGSVRCRLGALGAAIVEAPDLQPMQARLDRHLGKARTALDGAQSRCGAAKRGLAKRKLRQVSKRVRTVRRMLRSRHVRRLAPPTVTRPLVGATERLVTDTRTLTSGLTCP